jgi:outer membrane biosynthesis protein TonB
LREYIQCFSKHYTEIPSATDNDAISAFQNSMTCTSLIHRLGRRTPRTTWELLDIASNHADGEEAVAVTLNTPQGKGKEVVDHDEGTSSRFKKKKKKEKKKKEKKKKQEKKKKKEKKKKEKKKKQEKKKKKEKKKKEEMKKKKEEEEEEKKKKKKKKNDKRRRDDNLVVAVERKASRPKGNPSKLGLLKDHFEKLLDAPCPHHEVPVKHVLKDCRLIKNYVNSTLQPRAADAPKKAGPPLDNDDDAGAMYPGEAGAIHMIFGGSPVRPSRRVEKLIPR